MIRVITGPVKAAKSFELIKVCAQDITGRDPIVAFKPCIDTRDGDDIHEYRDLIDEYRKIRKDYPDDDKYGIWLKGDYAYYKELGKLEKEYQWLVVIDEMPGLEPAL